MLSTSAQPSNLDNANGGPEAGGGLFVALNNSGSSATLNNVLIADNTIGGSGTGPDCSGTVTSNGFNLVRDPTGCTGIPTGSDSTGENPLLDALALNAPGTTQTHALQAGSPAINSGDNATCPATDQRGVARQGTCDIGAYEAGVCGAGTGGPGETCDSGECCDTATCQFEAEGTACDDGNPDTSSDECSASGLCLGTAGGGGGGGGCGITSVLSGTSPVGYGLSLLSLAA